MVLIIADDLSKIGSLVLFLLCVSMLLRPLVSVGITDSSIISNSTILNPLQSGTIIVRHITSSFVLSLPLRVLVSDEVHTQYLPRACDGKFVGNLPYLCLRCLLI